MYTSSDQTDLFLECVYLRSQDKLLAIQHTCHRFKDFSPNASVLTAQVEKREIGYCSIRSGCHHLVLYFCPRAVLRPLQRNPGRGKRSSPYKAPRPNAEWRTAKMPGSRSMKSLIRSRMEILAEKPRFTTT